MSLAPPLRAGPDPDLRHLPVSLDLGGISVAEGVRAALSVAVLVALNEWAGIPALSEAALGALLTCLCDPGGPLRRRTPALLTFLVLGPLVTTGFSLLRGAGIVPASVIGSMWIFGTMFARAWGPVPMQVGNLLTVVSVLALDHSADLRTAAVLGGMFAAGSSWSLVLALVIWRIYPFRPVRRATADVFRRLGVLAADLSTLLAEDGVRPDWAAHARAHRRYVRDGIEAARTLLLDTIRGRGQGSARSNALLIQIEAADQLFGAMIALSDLLEHGDRDARGAARPMLPALRLLLAAIADAVLDEHSGDDERERPLFEHLLAQIQRGAESSALSGITGAIMLRLRIAALMTTPEGQVVSGGAPGDRDPLMSRLLAPLRANLSWGSAALRHAARAGCVALPALLLTLPTGVVYTHWLTITLVLTLQPFFAMTWQRALERVAGTVAGGVVAAGVLAFVHTPIGLAALLFPLAVVAFTVRRVSFGLFMAALTPLVVLLSELGQPGSSEFTIALARAGYTVAGGLMAVVGGLLLWPSWETPRLRTELQNAIRAHAAYADSELASLLGEVAPAAVEPDRRAAGVASNNLETTLSRAMQEPKPARAQLRPAMVSDAALRRIAGRLAALQFEPNLAGSVDLRSWRGWLAAAFAAILEDRPVPTGAPADAPGGSLARIARQVALIDGVLHPAKPEQPAAPILQPQP